jgi:hypothetical protein|tara:strand:- start:219 stop:446 length:228 start_codon:yes stop_codon:yes gene_type:complete
MVYFKTEIKLNPTFVASTRINIEARRYRKNNKRWYAELNNGFCGNEQPMAFISGDLKTVKKVIDYWKKEHTTITK